MATDRYYVCTKCKSEEWIDTLFDALFDFSKNKTRKCQSCMKDMEMKLTFDFGLGAEPSPCKILAVFLPEKIIKWHDEKKNLVKFYPFLVIAESIDEGYNSAWLPYWHIVEKKGQIIEKKYGQWAPFMDIKSYKSLLNNAKKKGFL